MEDVFFGVSDGVSKCFSCNNSPSHESDSGLSSQLDIGSPLPDVNNMTDFIENTIHMEDKDGLETDTDLLSFLMNSDDKSTSETRDMEQTMPNTNSDCSAPQLSGKIVDTPIQMKTASVKLVRLVTPVVPGKAVTSDDVVKAIEVKNKKNAQNAKMNREKKKVYIKGLEEEVDELKTENCSLREERKTLKHEKANLQEEVAYLKSVLANESTLSALLKNIPSIRNIKLSSSFLSNKQSAEEDHDYGSVGKKRRKAGVCLHVEGDSVSLEFCSRCAKMAKSSGVDK